MWPLVENWRITIWIIGLPLLIALICHISGRLLIRILTYKSKNVLYNSIILRCFRPVLWLAVLFFIRGGAAASLPQESLEGFYHLLAVSIIACTAWLVIKIMSVLEDAVIYKFKVDIKDNLRARKIRTQFGVLKRIIIIIICIITAALILMTFPRIRQIGTTILASAGIISVVVGLSAQKTIGTFIAGLQIAFTQPIRMDDVVIIEGEWGNIEEITLTYCVVKIWDQRRLIVPITYFMEKPFQNWTRTSAELIGTVYIYTDYTIPVEMIRGELAHILQQSPLWDNRVCVLEVTDAKEHAIELRALVSAANASDVWSLRCLVREKLIEFIRSNYPQSLPRFRAQLDDPLKALNSKETINATQVT